MALLEADHWIFSAQSHPDLSSILDGDCEGFDASRMTAPTPVSFLGVVSAEATISQLRQTRIQPSVIHLINLLLDEIIYSLISVAGSINPKDLRTDAVPQIFSAGKTGTESTGIKALARECTGEAELEVRSWYELNPGARRGFPPKNAGRGMTGMKEQADAVFPVDQAVDLMRLRLSELSSYSESIDNYEEIDDKVVAAWKAAGGDVSKHTVEPASAWIHAFVERVCETLLQQLNRVLERDSSIAICGPQDLYTALAEDERFWGWFARMKVKDALDEVLRAASKPRLSGNVNGRHTPISKSRSGILHERGSVETMRKASPQASPSRGSADSSRLNGIASVTRKGSNLSKKFAPGHERKESAFSSRGDNADEDPFEEARRDDQDEFDALVRSGETMKVSLTPSRLKTFEPPNARKAQGGSPRQATFNPKQDPLPPLPRSGSGSSLSTPPSKLAISSSKPGSGQRLVARGATTIEELADEESDSSPIAKAQGQRETLKELMASAPIDYNDQLPPKRTVPAVILASPPPGYLPAASQPPRASSRKTSVDDHDGSERGKKRSEARELADFFNSVPPPPPPQPSIEPPPLSAKSAKGFRGFMSKVTGSSKKKEEEARLARENAAWDTSSTSSNVTEHKPSMASMSTARNAPALDTMHRPRDEPAVPSKLRKRSDPSVEPDTFPTERGTQVPPILLGRPLPKFSEPSTLAQEHDVHIRPSNPQPDEVIQKTDDKAGANSVALPRPSGSSVTLQQNTTGVDSLAPVPQTASYEQSPSDTRSFQTANEGNDADLLAEGEDRISPATTDRSISHANGVVAEDEGSSDPLQRLASARLLLRHATSVEECRTLLDAYLTQLGVPQIDETDGLGETTAEAKVTAWLLDGEVGPPVRWPYSPASSEGLESTAQATSISAEKDMEEEGTPRSASYDDNQEEELVSEVESLASLDHEEAEAPVAVATSATRSPVRLSTYSPRV